MTVISCRISRCNSYTLFFGQNYEVIFINTACKLSDSGVCTKGKVTTSGIIAKVPYKHLISLIVLKCKSQDLSHIAMTHKFGFNLRGDSP